MESYKQYDDEALGMVFKIIPAIIVVVVLTLSVLASSTSSVSKRRDQPASADSHVLQNVEVAGRQP